MKADEVAKQVKHYLQFQDFTQAEHEYIFARTTELKRRFKNYETWHPLHDRTMAMIFEKVRRAHVCHLRRVFTNSVDTRCT